MRHPLSTFASRGKRHRPVGAAKDGATVDDGGSPEKASAWLCSLRTVLKGQPPQVFPEGGL
jgi:hypothetical protein